MLNRWREVRYDDDGCSIFECMSCKNQWSARTPPGYTECYTEDGKLEKDILQVLNLDLMISRVDSEKLNT